MSPTDVEDLFAPLAPVSVRRMFGGLGVYKDGLFFAIVADGVVYLKVDEETRSRFEQSGAQPFAFHPKGRRRVVLSYWSLPDEAADGGEAIAAWCSLALGAARRAVAAKAAPATKAAKPAGAAGPGKSKTKAKAPSARR